MTDRIPQVVPYSATSYGNPPFPGTHLLPTSKDQRCPCFQDGQTWRGAGPGTTEAKRPHRGAGSLSGLPEAAVVPLRTCPPHSLLRYPAHCACGHLPRPEGPLRPQRSTQRSAESAGENHDLIRSTVAPHPTPKELSRLCPRPLQDTIATLRSKSPHYPHSTDGKTEE